MLFRTPPASAQRAAVAVDDLATRPSLLENNWRLAVIAEVRGAKAELPTDTFELAVHTGRPATALEARPDVPATAPAPALQIVTDLAVADGLAGPLLSPPQAGPASRPGSRCLDPEVVRIRMPPVETAMRSYSSFIDGADAGPAPGAQALTLESPRDVGATRQMYAAITERVDAAEGSASHMPTGPRSGSWPWSQAQVTKLWNTEHFTGRRKVDLVLSVRRAVPPTRWHRQGPQAHICFG
jgi:hypothetical protein